MVTGREPETGEVSMIGWVMVRGKVCQEETVLSTREGTETNVAKPVPGLFHEGQGVEQEDGWRMSW